MIDPKLITILSSVELFKDAPEAALEELASLVTRHEFTENQLVIKKGNEGDSLYIIASGTVRVHDGDQIVASMGAGSFFGEISFLDNAPRSMSVSADSPAVLYRITRNDFYKVFKTQPEITQKIIFSLTRRLRSQNERVINDLRMREAELSAQVKERTRELEEKNDQLSKTLEELRNTQEQLVQQEKLASLGQLTAGIAHEIKNPLNFINNFAKLSFELVDEIVGADKKDEREETGMYLRQNLEKIHSHGSRADLIVKGMLEHTRTGGEGTRQFTDVNKICEQMMNMSYESMRNVTPEFTCQLEMNFMPMKRVEITVVDFSKMVVNLINNALYAVREKQKMGVSDFTPVVRVATSLDDGRLTVKVYDNGTGIPKDIMKQIFNPFFTTKPTGASTGLGLSIAHDIAHAAGGFISCESTVGKETEFTVSMPVNVEEEEG
jgi:two-component system, NtrC family, sensor kinase